MIRKLLRQSGANSTVETAFAFVFAVPSIFLVFELCLFAYTQAILSDAARVGVRYAIVHGNDSSTCSGPGTGCGDPTGANVGTVVQQYATKFFKNLSTVQVSVNYLDASSAPPARVQVTVNYTYVPTIATAFNTLTLKATSEGRIVF